MMSLVILTKHRDIGNRLLEHIGCGPENFTVSVTNNYYGLHTWASSGLVEILTHDIAPDGFNQDMYETFMIESILSSRSDNNNHFEDVLQLNGLQQIFTDES